VRPQSGILRVLVVTLVAVGAFSVAHPRRVAAADAAKYALVIEGTSGGDEYATLHRQWLDAYLTLFRDKFKYDAAHLIVLSETPRAGEEKSTAESVRAVLARLASSATAADQVAIVLIGHGSGEGADAKFNLVGPDLSAAEWAKLVEPIKAHLVFVDTTSASFPYLAGLSAPGRVVITATNSYAQRFHTVFADAFAQALGADAADEDKNGRISLLEAVTYASRLVKAHYDQGGIMATEIAAIDDDGDGKGRVATDKGPDGAIAGVTYLDNPAVPTSTGCSRASAS
jgi:hypothetical protein